MLNTQGYVWLKPEFVTGLKLSDFQNCLTLFLQIAREGSSPSGKRKNKKQKKHKKNQLSLSGKKDYLHSSFLEIFAAQLYPWYNIYLLTRSQGTLLCFRDWFLFRASVMQPTHAAIWTNSEIKHHMLSHVALYFLSRHVVQLQPDTLQDFISV